MIVSARAEESLLTLDCGDISGTVSPTLHGPIHEFYHLPYALPPVGPRRWTHSKPASGWEGVLDSTAGTWRDNPVKCVQAWDSGSPGGVAGQEDCLYLTVRTPNPAEKFPVLVWIHGGSLKTGHSEYPGYAPDALFTADLGVVSVNINYRLGVFGFFSSPDIWEEEQGNRGNFGIGDALTALEWIRDNIAHFGGDPERVTILGESSGGTIVFGLLGSSKAAGLFHQAISLSGCPIWKATPELAHQRRSNYTARAGCHQQSSDERRECLKTAPVLDLIKARDLDRGWGFYDFPYSEGEKGESMDYAIIDGSIVETAPFDLHNVARLSKVRVVIGNTAQETGTNAIDYNTNVVLTWKDAEILLLDKLTNLARLRTDLVLAPGPLLIKTEQAYGFKKDTNSWWPQIYFDTLTTDVRTTCINNKLVSSLNQHPDIEALRLYVRSRPDTSQNGVPWSSIHGWDTEALFNYGYYGPYFPDPTLVANLHQRRFRDVMRELVARIVKGEEIEGWTGARSLVLENEDFPGGVTVSEAAPQEEHCIMWEEHDMLQFGWQN